MTLGLKVGDQVIVPSVTFLATANAARYVGADVVFADVDADTGLMGPTQLTEAMQRAPSACAVFPVHLGGQTENSVAIEREARSAGLKIVEDACHAIGTTLADNTQASVGACARSDMCVFSFHPVKSIAMGEGGAVTTNDDGMAERLRLFRNHGMVREPSKFLDAAQAFDAGGVAHPWYYEMHEFGFNYRASDLHCALGRSQLTKLARFVEHRRALAARYDSALSELAPLVQPVTRTSFSVPAWHLYVLLIDFASAGVTRDEVMRDMARQGIGTQVHYIPVHRQPYYRKLQPGLQLPGADRYYERALSVPLFASMCEADVLRVVDTLKQALKI
jgi:dTDP-4-amino-4,6-dideoxygalactose transaminase